MSTDQAGDITELILAYRDGNRASLNLLIPKLYNELRAIAKNQLRHRAAGETLNATALVNEAYVKLRESQTRDFPSTRDAFMGLAACVMRSVIVDHFRAKATVKRGAGAEPLPLIESMAQSPQPDSQVLALDEALRKLEETDERLVKLVECKFFAGYSGKETAEILGCSRRTVQRDWADAKSLIAQMMS